MGPKALPKTSPSAARVPRATAFLTTRFPWAVGLVFLLAAATPSLIGYIRQDADWRFTGIVRLSEDNNSYAAWAKQAQEGFLLFENLYTTEPQRRVLFLPFFWAVGAAARLTGLPLFVAMNIAHLAGAAFFLWALWRWLGLRAASPPVRAAAFALTLFGGGFGAALDFVMDRWPGGPDWLRFDAGAGVNGAADLWEFDLFTFSNAAYFPLAPAALGLLFLSLVSVEEDRPARGGALCGLLFLVHPYDGVIACALAAVLFWALRRPRAAPLAFYGIAAVPAAYLLWALQANEVFSRYTARLPVFQTPLLSYLIGLGPLLALAVRGARSGWARDRRAFLPMAWALAALFCMAVPFGVRHKLLHGAHAAFACLAAAGLLELWQRRRAAGPRLALGALLLMGLWTPLRLWTEDVRSALDVALPFYLPAVLREPLAFLDREPAGSAVLASRRLGLFIPPFTGGKTYVGHWDQTLDAAAKEREAETVLSGATPEDLRRDFLRSAGLTHVLLSPRYRSGPWDEMPGMEKAFENEGYKVYRVR